jgi:hypothetical protein
MAASESKAFFEKFIAQLKAKYDSNLVKGMENGIKELYTKRYVIRMIFMDVICTWIKVRIIIFMRRGPVWKLHAGPYSGRWTCHNSTGISSTAAKT